MAGPTVHSLTPNERRYHDIGADARLTFYFVFQVLPEE